MQPGALVRLDISDTSLEELVALYVDWALGAGAFEFKRSDRIIKGVPDTVTTAQLRVGGNFQTPGQGSLRSRVSEDGMEWVLHWLHRDPKREEFTWHNVVSVKQAAPGEVRIKHLTARTSRVANALHSVAAAPAILPKLVEQFGAKLRPSQVVLDKPTLLNSEDVDSFLMTVIADRARRIPIVVISSALDTEKPLLSPFKLLQLLRGTAHVAVLDSVDASWSFRHALEHNGYDVMLACYNGAVRVFMPGFETNSKPPEHPLYLPPYIKRLAVDSREYLLGGGIVRDIANGMASETTLAIVEQIDLNNWRKSAQALLAAPSSTATETDLSTTLQRVHELEVRLKESQDLQEYFAKEHNDVVAESAVRAAEVQRLQQRVEALEAQSFSTVYDALLAAERLFQARIVVLPSAHSAAKNCQFRHPDELFAVLTLLASSCGETAFNLPDALEKQFGNRAKWKPKEHSKTMDTFGEQRKHKSSTGQIKEYQKHITLGHGQYEWKCMQIYYESIPQGKIEIAYCGKHLDTHSRDT